jgi:hypothetical protein
VVTVAELISGLAAGEKKIVTGEVTLTGNGVTTIANTAILTIAPGAKLTTSAAGKFDIATGGELRVKEGGIFEIANGTTTNGGNGTIVLESGSTSIDRSSPMGTYMGATSIVHAGAIVIHGQDKIFIGPASGNNKGQVIQLIAGTITSDATALYVLDGQATLVSQFGIAEPASLKITGTSTVTVAGGGELLGFPGAVNFLGRSEKNAKIVLQDANSFLSRQEITNTMNPIPNIEDTAGNSLWETVTIETFNSYRVTGPAVLVKSDDYSAPPAPPAPPASSTNGTWVKQ